LEVTKSNLNIAYKWLEHATAHIARVLKSSDYTKVFALPQEFELLICDSPKWDPPPQPTITFLEAAKNPTPKSNQPIPKNITKQVGGKELKNKTKETTNTTAADYDNNTVTTVASQNSYSQNDISDLQSESRQHSQQLEDHIRRMNSIELNIKNDLNKINSKILTLDNRYKLLQKGQDTLFKDVENLAKDLPDITSTMNDQQQQLTTFIKEQDEKHQQQDEKDQQQQQEIETLRQIQFNQTKQIARLETLLRMLPTQPPTPISQQKIRKKHRQSNDMSSSQSVLPHQEHTTTQLEMIINSQPTYNDIQSETVQNTTTPDTSFTEHSDEAVYTDTLAKDDQSDQLSPTKPRDLGNSYPGEDT
jgi:hypothetical protein